MPSQLVSSSGCCQPCDSEPIVVNIPGPQGEPGENGTNGTNGINSFTYTTASFLVPALGSSVLVFVDNTDFLPESVAGQFFVSIQGVGYMQVLSVDGLQLTLQNPAAGVLGIANAVPTTLIPQNSLITLAGAIGATGATGAAGDAPKTASYICRTQDSTLTNETALELLAAGYLKTLGNTGSGAVTTSAVVPVADIFGTLPINKGGTALSATPASGQLLIGNGTGFTLAQLTAGTNVTITPGAGSITIDANPLAGFSYVTFTRRINSTGSGNVPLLASGTTANPFNAASFPSAVIAYTGIDTSSGFNAANGRYVCPASGYYRIDAYLSILGASGTAKVTAYIRKNGSDVVQSQVFDVNSSGYHPVSLMYIDLAATNDYYEIYLNTTSHSLYAEKFTSFSVQRIQA